MNNKWVVLCVVVMMSFMSCLDGSIVNIALPVMRAQLGASMASVEWVVTAYLTVICATILAFGRLGDLRGKCRVFQWGVAFFTLSSLACALCRSLPALVVSRLAQGIGASAYMANNQGIIAQTFAKGERGKALGILASAVALGQLLGAPVGGFIVSRYSWNVIFLVNVPLGIIAFASARLALPKETSVSEPFDVPGAALFGASVSLAAATVATQLARPGSNSARVPRSVGESSLARAASASRASIPTKGEPFDVPGAALFGASVAFVAAGSALAHAQGVPPAIAACAFALSVACLAIFVARERACAYPLLDLSVFREPSFSLALACALIAGVCMNASGFLLPFYLENARSFGPATAGLVMTLSPLVVAVLSPASGALSDRIGCELPSLIGFALMGPGFLLMSSLGLATPIAAVLCFLFAVAVGQGLFLPTNNTIIMSSVPRDKLGVAGSVNSLVRNVGQFSGVSLATALLYGRMSAAAGRPVSDYPAGNDALFASSMDAVYVALGALTLAGFALALARFLRARRHGAGKA